MMHLLAQGLANYQNWFWPSVRLFVCTIAIAASGTLGHLEITPFCTLLLNWINKAPSLYFPPFTFERYFYPTDMSKVSSKTGQFESQRRVFRLVSYFYLTSCLTNISFGHYKTGLHCSLFSQASFVDWCAYSCREENHYESGGSSFIHLPYRNESAADNINPKFPSVPRCDDTLTLLPPPRTFQFTFFI